MSQMENLAEGTFFKYRYFSTLVQADIAFNYKILKLY